MNSIHLAEDDPDYKPSHTAEALAKLERLHAELAAIEPQAETIPNGLYRMTSKGDLIPARFNRPRRHHRPEGVLLEFNTRQRLVTPKA